MKIAVIYSDNSQECERACQLLTSLGAKYRVYYVNDEFSYQQFQMEFGCDAHFPQITLGSKHLGGLKDALHYLKEKGYLSRKPKSTS